LNKPQQTGVLQMINESVTITGSPTITLYDLNNNIKQQFTIPNLVVTAGKNVIASRLIGTTPSVMTHMAVGSNNTAPAANDTALAAQISNRVSLTSSTVSGNVVSYSATFGAGVSTGTIVEAGIFNALTAGSMLCRTIFPAINKESTDSLTINWNVTIN